MTHNHNFRLLCYITALAAPLTAAKTTAYVTACCNANSTVSIVSTFQNRVAGNFTAGPGSNAITFAGPGTAWVTNAGDNSISIVSLRTGGTAKTIQLNLQPWLIKTSPDGASVYVVTGSFTGNLEHYSSTLLRFDAKTGAATGKVALPNDGLSNPGLAISPDSSRVYASFDSKTIVVYSVSSGTVVSTWTTSPVSTWTATGTLTLSPDGQTLYAAGQVLTAIDTGTGTPRGTVTPPGFSQEFSFVGSAVTTDGSTLYASYAAEVGTGSGIAAIDTATLVVTASGAVGSELQQPVISNDGATLYVPDAIDSLLYVVSTSNLTATASVALRGFLSTALVSPSGNAVYVPNSSTANAVTVDPSTLSVTGSIGVAGTANVQPVLHGPTAPTSTSDGSHIYVAGKETNSISEIDTATNRVTRTFTTGAQSPSVTGDNPPSIMVTPNGQQIYVADTDYLSVLTEIDVATGKVNGVPCLIGSGCALETMAVLPDSSRVYLSGFGFTFDPPAPIFFYVVDTATLKVIAAPRMKTVGPMVSAPSGAYLYISTGSAISIFNTTTNMVTGSIPMAGVTAMAFSPNGAIAFAATGSTVNVINTATQQVAGSFSLGANTASGLSVTPDGSQVWATLANSTSVAVFNTAAKTVQTVDLGLSVAGVAFAVQ